MTGGAGRSTRQAAAWLPARLVAACVLVVALGWGGYLAWVVRTDPALVYLPSDPCARWIVANEPVLLGARHPGFFMTTFRTSLPAGPARDAVLTFRALRIAEVALDGRTLLATPRDVRVWKQEYRLPLHVEAGGAAHELAVTVVNQNGPPALLACAPALGVATGSGWEAQKARDAAWSPALVAEPRLAELSLRFPTAGEALRAVWPLLAVLFALGAAAALAADRLPPSLRVSPSAFRWLLVAAWLVLAVNDAPKLPLYVGFDVSAHLAYIKYLVEHWRVPLATEGWQMFQPPLYHALSAFLVWLPASPFLGEDDTVRLMRMIPLACGVAQVELAYRAARHVFPDRAGLQRLATLLGALLPINLYASQYLGNEPLTGVLTAGAIVLLLGWVRAPAAALGPSAHWLLGVVLGLAMLSKPTAVLAVVPALVVLAQAHARAGQGPACFLAAATRALGAMAVVAGWYYVRNWIYLGTPFVGGWDVSRGIEWWQEPGYRVAAHVTGFGTALRHPVFGGVAGLWDAEYASLWLDGWLSSVMEYDFRPPWNYALMLPAPWLALVPTAAMLVGAATAWWRPEPTRRGLVLAAGLVGLYLAATLSLYLRVPIFAAAKATQLLGLTPCFAVLGAAGYGMLARGRAMCALLAGATVCWAVCAYGAYFVW